MKEARIVATMGIYGSLILSTTSTGKITPWIYVAVSILWLGKYIYLKMKK